MTDFVVEVDRSVPLRNSLVLTAFPTFGNVSSIAARFIVEVAGLSRIGGVYSPRLPPLAAVNRGIPEAAIEVYAGERVCGLDGVCDSLVVVTSLVPVPDDVAHDLAVALLDWSREVGKGDVAVLEGIKSSDAAEPEPEIVAVASSEPCRNALKAQGIPLFEEGYIGGVSGVLLHRGAAWGLDVYGFLVRAKDKEPDARAAAALVRVVDQALVRAAFDEKALEDSVHRIEDRVKHSRLAARDQIPARDMAYI